MKYPDLGMPRESQIKACVICSLCDRSSDLILYSDKSVRCGLTKNNNNNNNNSQNGLTEEERQTFKHFMSGVPNTKQE